MAALLAGIGMSGPRWGFATRSTQSRALNIVLIMDISRSMLAQDVLPDRLGRAVGIARRLVQDLPGDRLGLIAFAQRPYLLAPLTLDQSALSLQLDALDPEIASEGGSGLPEALNLARSVLAAASEGGDRAVVVLTDGESHSGERPLVEAGSEFKSNNITLVTVPLGDAAGARIPVSRGETTAGSSDASDIEASAWHRDAAGVEVITRRRDDLLQAMTEAAGGVLIEADAPDPAGEVRRSLERLTRATVRDQLAADLIPRAWLFAAASLLVLLVQAFTRRTAALIGISLFVSGNIAAQRPTIGARLLSRGDTAAAARAFLLEAEQKGSDTAWFNAGTAALIHGDVAGAREALERATTSLDPDLRRRALYNLGTAMLVAARRDSTGRDSLLAGAESRLRESLQLAPGDAAAKFNYELARRLKPPPPPPQSGGGGGGGDQPQPQQQAGGREGMTQAEAEQVLNAMDRAERQTRQDLARRQRRGQPSSGPDW
jgi:Ca-activated chloride channel family protein